MTEYGFFSRLPALAGLAALTFLLAGCGGPADSSPPKFHVRGKVVTKDGKAAAGALVVLHPANATTGAPPRGTTDKDGVFVVGSRLADDGAAEGEYDVTLIWPKDQDPRNPSENTPPDRLKNQYNDVKHAKWHVRVKAAENQLEPFTLD